MHSTTTDSTRRKFMIKFYFYLSTSGSEFLCMPDNPEYNNSDAGIQRGYGKALRVLNQLLDTK